MVRWFFANIRTIILAFILAVIVWVSAVTASDPDVTQTYPQPIPIEIIGQNPSLIISNEYPATASIILKAPRSVWDKLLQSPQSLRAIVDLSGVEAGEHEIKIQVQVAERPAQVIAVTPATLNLVLEPLVTQTFKVTIQVIGETAPGYLAGTPSTETENVLVSGPKSLVDQVTQARATVLLNNARDNVEAYPAVILLDGKNRQVGSLTAQPENLQVTVPITQQGGYRDLAVKIITTGQVATGYRLSSIAVIPPVVTVYSEDPALVDGLPGFVETEPLNLEGANANIEVRLMLVLPEGVSVIGDPTVLVQANISPIESSVIIADKKVDIIGLGPNLAAQIAPDTVDVILTGPLPVLDQLKINDVRVVIDLTGLSTGIHQVEPKVILRVDEVKVESVNPSTLEVTISYKSLLIPSSQP